MHGAYDELVSLLQAAGVVDDRLQWSAGAAHVVSVGDLLDRGDDSRRVMDLLMRLQVEAGDSGGHLHVVLGNHEVLNLTGDLRYVSDGEFAAFAADEQPAEREAAMAGFATRYTDPDQARAEFDERFPPGFFGLRAAFSPDGHYGQWLLTLPVMLQIDDVVYVHGGLPPVVAEMGLDDLNRRSGADLAQFVSLWHDLRALRLIPFDQAADTAAIEWAKLLQAQTPPALSDAARSKIERFVELGESPVFSALGPLWYRGSARCHPLLETDILNAALERLSASRVVVGHTPTRKRRAASRLDDRVVMIDSGMLASYYNGTPVALVIERGRMRVVYPALPQIQAVEKVDHDNAADWAGGLADVEQFLRTEPVVARARDQAARQTLVTLRANDGRQARARVIAGRAGRRELAAYALDRLLGTGIVPVTVARTLDRSEVALQLLRDDWIDDPTRVARGLALPGWCAAGNYYELMSVLDALTANNRSDPATIRYSRDRERIWVNDFAAAFSTTRALPRYLAGNAGAREIAGEVARRLSLLDQETLESALGELLSKREYRALLARRDAVLADWTIR